MALVVKDRVKETTSTTGTGALTLGGAVANFVTFSSVLSDGDTTYYAIVDDGNGAFEVGLGTYASSGTTLTRTTVLASSNSGSAVNLQAGTKNVFITYPADKSVYLDAAGDLVGQTIKTFALSGGTADGTTIGGTIAAAGTFTNLTASGTLSFPDNSISGDDVDGGTISNFASTGIDDNATSIAVTIDSSQKVGIGTTSPGDYHSLSQFVVAQSGDAGITIASGTSNDGRIFFADGTTGTAESEGTIAYNHADNSMSFSTSDTVRMSIDGAGTVQFESAIEEQQYSLTGTLIDPNNGTIQYKTLAANTTFTHALNSGEFVTLMIDDGSAYTVTWPTTTWVGGSAPTLGTTGYNVIHLWRVAGVLYGAFIGTTS